MKPLKKPLNPDDNPEAFKRALLLEGAKFCPECLVPLVVIEQVLRTPGASRRFLVGCVSCQSQNGGGFRILAKIVTENQSAVIPAEAMGARMDIGVESCEDGEDLNTNVPDVEKIIGIPAAYIPQPIRDEIKTAWVARKKSARKTKGRAKAKGTKRKR